VVLNFWNFKNDLDILLCFLLSSSKYLSSTSFDGFYIILENMKWSKNIILFRKYFFVFYKGICNFDYMMSYIRCGFPFGVAANRPPITACALPHANIFTQTTHTHTQMWKTDALARVFPVFAVVAGTLTQFSMADVPKPCSPSPPTALPLEFSPAALSPHIGILSTCFPFFHFGIVVAGDAAKCQKVNT